MQRLLFIVFWMMVQLNSSTVKAQQITFQNIKLFRYGTIGNENPAVILSDGKKLDVSLFGSDYDEKFFGSDGINRLRKWLVENASRCAEVPQGSRIGSCVARPSKIIGIGLNYVKHAKESGVDVPKEPILFFKSTTSLSGPNDTLVIPRNSVKTDWEVELAIIMGKTTAYVTEETAVSYIAGFSIMNDYSERAWQLEGTGQWAKGKSADGFAPLGPYFIPADIFPQFQQLKVWLTVNGDTLQNSNTSDMVFGVKHLVSYLSRHMTLLPGDVITTGTPEGVGLGLKPQRYLKPGDRVVTGIEDLGVQQQITISAIQKDFGETAFKQYTEWVALGSGGLPHTYEGFERMRTLSLNMKNPFNTKQLSAGSVKTLDVKNLKAIPARKGKRPAIAPFPIPHRQTDQHSDNKTRIAQQQLFDNTIKTKDAILVYRLSQFERNFTAVYLKDSAAGNSFVMPLTHGEIGHIHPADGSMHLTLSPSDAKTIIEKGWGELHSLAGQGILPLTYTIIYAPRNTEELVVVQKILNAAIAYSINNKQ